MESLVRMFHGGMIKYNGKFGNMKKEGLSCLKGHLLALESLYDICKGEFS